MPEHRLRAYRKIIEHLFKNTEIRGILQFFSTFLQKKIDFFKIMFYTGLTWSKMVVKWCKMEEVRLHDR